MKILYITHKPIYPKIDGGCVAMDNFLRTLIAANHTIKHLTVSTEKHPFEESEYPRELHGEIHPEAIEINTRITPIKTFFALFSKKSYNVRRFHSSAMEQRITAIIQEQSIDCVILESLFTTVYLDQIRSSFNGKVYLRTHNVEFKIWENLAGNSTNFLKKKYYTKLAKDLKRYEESTLNTVDGIISISTEDTTFFRAFGVTTPITTISLGFSLEDASENDYRGTNFFHLGALNWKPNREAVDCLVDLFPRINAVLPSAQLHIVGQGSKALKVTTPNVHLDGFVDDVNAHSTSIGILVTPITSGSGIRVKILEMMAIGIPVITTTIGAQGIDYTTSNCLVIANTDEEIIAACHQLATSETLRKEIGSNGKAYIHQHHSLKTNIQLLNEFIGTA